ncbi:sigma-54-dependent transcriptional regulator [Pirellulimonas nuda]|uniref:sigma-54-dependent transcriptional regulator n=1 Tax=Pirellulimonas nuda TaxID=2528009 RepID=UPI001E5A687A|nr:sigma-54 dependent transcriptional regulator [Pirellulimonas nuda]
MANILVVDDEQSICWGLEKLGQSLGHEVRVAPSAERGLALAAESPPDLLALDVRLPGMDGLTAMGRFREIIGDVPIIVMTAFGDLQTAVRAVGSGAQEYVLKPFDLHEIRSAFERALRVAPLAAARPEPGLDESEPTDGMVGRSPVMHAMFKRIALAAASRANVLLSGESGVGKELAAQAIHRHSPRRDGPFVAVNVAALNPTLAESELFGHVDGAFTGASRTRQGLLARADGGTLFLDEVADIPLDLQVKLLRAIELGEATPVGSDRPVKADFRVVSATHQDLAGCVRAGAFRHDLYFRICAFEICLPALRDRIDDIPLLA